MVFHRFPGFEQGYVANRLKLEFQIERIPRLLREGSSYCPAAGSGYCGEKRISGPMLILPLGLMIGYTI